MRTLGMFVAIALLFTINAIVLAGAWYNRSGEPDAVMTVTEREMRVVGTTTENSGIALRIISHHHLYTALGQVTNDPSLSFDQSKLETLGFDVPTVSDEDKNYYDRQLPRRAYALLEFDGPSWAAWNKRLTEELLKMEQAAAQGKKTPQELDSARESIERARRTDSHLFIIDVGADPQALRKQYPDRQRYLILACEVRVARLGDHSTSGITRNTFRGTVNLLSSELHVPHRMHADLGEQKKSDAPFREVEGMPDSGPRYQVTLQNGKSYEPWIERILPLH